MYGEAPRTSFALRAACAPPCECWGQAEHDRRRNCDSRCAHNAISQSFESLHGVLLQRRKPDTECAIHQMMVSGHTYVSAKDARVVLAVAA